LPRQFEPLYRTRGRDDDIRTGGHVFIVASEVVSNTAWRIDRTKFGPGLA
jgi:hypothetical protein